MYGNVFDPETERMLLKSILEYDRKDIGKIYNLTKLLLSALNYFNDTITGMELEGLSSDTRNILLIIDEIVNRIEKYYGKK